MKIAETEGTDIINVAESEGTDLNHKSKRFKINYQYLVLLSAFFIQSINAAELSLYSIDNETYKGVIKQNSKIEFVEGYIESEVGYFLVNESLVNTAIKATDDGTGDKATDDGTGDKATDDGTGGKATDDGTGDKLLIINLGCNNNGDAGTIKTASTTENIIFETININGLRSCFD